MKPQQTRERWHCCGRCSLRALTMFTTAVPVSGSALATVGAQQLAVRGICHRVPTMRTRHGGIRRGLPSWWVADVLPCPPHLAPPPGLWAARLGGRHRSHLSARVLSEVLPADMSHDPGGQCITQHVNHGAETVPGGPRRAVSGRPSAVRGAGRGQCSPQQHPQDGRLPGPPSPPPPGDAEVGGAGPAL